MKVAALGIALALALTGIAVEAPSARGADPLPKIVATLAAGSGPYLSHYAALTGQTWVSDNTGSNVTVYDDATLKSVASVYAANPSGIDIDDAAAEVFIPDRANPGHVEVVNETTRVIEKNVSVGANPERAETDPVDGLEAVANYGSGNVSVINTSTLTVVHTLKLGAGTEPYGMTWDSTHDLFWLTEFGANRVLAFSASYAVTVNVSSSGSEPAGICYDPGDNGVWVGDVGSDTATEFNATSGALKSTVVVGSGPYAVSCDTDAGLVIVGNSGGNSVSILSSSEHVVIDTLGVGSQPYGDRALDPVRDYVFVANYGSDNVSVLYDGAPAPVGGIVVGTPTALDLPILLLIAVVAVTPFLFIFGRRRRPRDPFPGGLASLPGRYR